MSLYDLLPVPNLLDAKKVLCIQPHPDDMDISCGGTLAKLATEGAHITYVTVTDGGAGTEVRKDEGELIAVRRGEQWAAGAYIGVSDYVWLDYKDADAIPREQLQHDLIRIIREQRPDTIVTVDPWLMYEAHPAHRDTGLAAAAAVLFCGMANIHPEHLEQGLQPFRPERVVFSFSAQPNTFVDITSTWERKLKAIRSHQSQFPDSTWSFYGKYLDLKSEEYGKQAGCARAEGLKVLAPTHLHCNVDAFNM
ncbi:MAG: hypothetical protein A2201_12345 [Alicyclobacillus sp. RIFOXYA1_FULL_53_8]|nr:MAG: hypothetical protein A2201_12345 [Alicyclobacillus sp. RIFOXYA1_FULL_53_8]